ncbi:MAG: XTP/dITP diphosphatase [Deltaproteobacteria bacterium]|jgi:XTP/dITP diphosphohydrolase|nr:XTP/dITP diphosphatase [Deltaproteobacteria bacterium]
MKMILATKNKGKIKEFQALAQGMAIELLSLEDIPDMPDVLEDGCSFHENALKKACAIAKHTGITAIADDSGLEVDALNGAPGIHSARYAGERAGDQENIQKLLKALNGLPLNKRTARFRCVIAVCTPQGRHITTEGTCEGIIAIEPHGFHGFGYDPVFLLPDRNCTMAELEPGMKNLISHRAMALARLKDILPAFLKETGGNRE